MTRFTLFIFTLFCCAAFTRDTQHQKFTPETVAVSPDSVNTARDVTYLGEEEKRVIALCNIARTQPKVFAQNYAQPFIDSAGKKNSYTNSLLRTLRTMKPAAALLPDEALTKTAAAHAEKSGKAGTTGHSGKKERFKKSGFSYWGENCSYGYSDALDIVMQLLIDDGIKNLGHRKNILDPKFTHIGVAIRKHKRYNWNCVQNFGGRK
ncbi:MAG: CAP domain-containing protein [Bacteroidetes bacterium]|nr:CAP domain-containing protein [Bacteroidota bacterium]